MERFKPFPQIPRIDNEPKLEGAPESPEDSIFLSVPELAEMSGVVVDFNKADSKRASNIIQEYARKLLDDPEKMFNSLDALHILSECQSYRTDVFEEKIVAKIEGSRRISSLGELELESILIAWSESYLYGNFAEELLKKGIESCGDRKSLINFLYNLISAAVMVSPDCMKKVGDALNGMSPILKRDSKQFRNLTLAVLDKDEEVVRKSLEIGQSISIINAIFEIDPGMSDYISESLSNDDEFVEEFKKLLHENEYEDDLRRYFGKSAHPSNGLNVRELKDDRSYPESLLSYSPGFLGVWNNEHIAQAASIETGNKMINVALPGTKAIFELDGNIGAHMKGMIEGADKSKIIEDELGWRSLQYLVPKEVLDEEVKISLIEDNERLIDEMRKNPRFLLSPRGDIVLIKDDVLTPLGIQDILFKLNSPNKKETQVIVNVCGMQFSVLLDDRCRFKFKEFFRSMSGRKMLVANESLFIENVILSHLHAIKCSEKVYEIATEKNGEVEIEKARKAFTSRRAHRRILTEGHKPTHKQIENIFSKYEIDIIRMNLERKAGGEAREVTYVSEVENIAIGGKDPIKSIAPDATKALRDILDRHKN